MILAHALVLLLSVAPKGLLDDPEAARLFGDAQKAFETQEFTRAAQLIEEAYLIEPNPQLLYPWAQAERSAGNCETAIQLYERFLESKPSEQFAEATRGNIERCREQLAEADAGDEPVEDDAVVSDDPVPVDEPLELPGPGKGDEPPPPTKPWYKDPVGGVLVGVGVAGIGVGGALMGIASARAGELGRADLNSEYEDGRDRAKKLHAGGIATLSIGSALLVAGVIRWVIVAKKRDTDRAALFVAPTGAHAWTLGLSGKF